MKKFLVSSGVIAAFIAAAFLIFFDWVGKPPGRGREVIFTVQRGWGVRDICDALADSGLVRNPLYTLWRFRRMSEGISLQAGTYLLDDQMRVDSILTLIAQGEIIPVPTHWLTLPPGLTLGQSLDRISSSLRIERSLLDSLSTDSSFMADLGLSGLEGYLYPETYEFADSLAPDGILSRIVRTGLDSWQGRWEDASRATGLDAHQTVILASLVEREAVLDSERSIVAGVFVLRLRRGMKLESCATVQYALGEVKEYLLYSDLRIESPYNTYLYSGLPPGPICSPGLPSLEAAILPDTSAGYLYFVSRDDGSGGHLFATTYPGHLDNRRRVRQGLTN
jgi:UPF0755 protein